jgi:hypothetical protein
MAAQVETINDGNNPLSGIYGLYNRFFIRITSTSAGANQQYQVKVSMIEDPTIEEVIIVDPIDDVGIVDPVKVMGEKYFKYLYDGNQEACNPFGYSTVKIEVGEINGTPPVFQGYDTDQFFYFYNGYTPNIRVDNYRIPSLFDTTPIKLPRVNKTSYLEDGNVDTLSLFSLIPFDGGESYQLQDLVGEYYNAAGVLQTESN